LSVVSLLELKKGSGMVSRKGGALKKKGPISRNNGAHKGFGGNREETSKTKIGKQLAVLWIEKARKWKKTGVKQKKGGGNRPAGPGQEQEDAFGKEGCLWCRQVFL